jgi:hypothetical protein
MKQELKSAIRTDFTSFVRKAFLEMHDSKLEDEYIGYLCFEAAKIATGDSIRMVVNIPPRHLKTFTCSVCLPAWILGNDPYAKIMIVAYGEDLAKDIAHKIRSILRSPWYQEAFATRIDKSRFSVMDFATTEGGKVYAVSIGGQLTGHGGDYIFVDDPAQISDADDVEKLLGINRVFDEVIVNRLDNPKTGSILIVAHRLNENDLSGHVLREGGWDHVVLAYIAERTKKYKVGHGIWRRQKGTLLRDDNEANVKKNRARPNFQSVYQQNPAATALPCIKGLRGIEWAILELEGPRNAAIT